MSVATTLREERIRRGITAEQLGKRVGVSKSCICQYERQARSIPDDILGRAAVALQSPRLRMERCYQCPVSLVKVPFLDRVDRHPTTVHMKLLEETQEVLDAAPPVKMVNKLCRDDFTTEEWKALEKFLAEVVDLKGCIDHWIAMICDYYGITSEELSAMFYKKLRNKGYLSYAQRANG